MNFPGEGYGEHVKYLIPACVCAIWPTFEQQF